METKKKVRSRKVVAGVEMMLMMVSLFAFCYFIGLSDVVFSLVSAEEEEEFSFEEWWNRTQRSHLFRNETRTTYEISSLAEGFGCCFISKDEQRCGTSAPDNCVADSPFAEGLLCKDTAFCRKGCCYDEASGIYDRNVLSVDCLTEWVKDPNCNLPGAALGCCILGAETSYETEGQCQVDSFVLALGDSGGVDWRKDVNEAGCFLLATEQKEGACVLEGGACKFVTGESCHNYGGDFFEDYLCTSPELNTSCEMTRQTQCVDGKDGVYFVDSCGNPANIYNVWKVDDVDYWDRVAELEDLCGSRDIDGGNANSEECGNCNRFAGSICSSADEDNFNVDIGDFYCRDTSCLFKGESYRNGESWCVYDGAIGEGNDVVGSRHWRYVCSQGVVVVEPCADYRNQICIQADEFDVNGKSVPFRDSACVANNWRECINLNSEEDGTTACESALNCRIETVDVADYFEFDICLPQYPAGFSLSEERSMTTASKLCGMGTQTCTVVREGEKWGRGCEYVANEDCLTSVFAEEMNDFCRGLGDCGGSVNIVGEYSENYDVTKDGVTDSSLFLSSSWVDKLKDLAKPVPGQFAEVENYSVFLEAAGIWGPSTSLNASADDTGDKMQDFASGLSGVSMAISFLTSGSVLGMTVIEGGLLGSSPGLSAFGGAAMGASIGMLVGTMLANYLELSPGGTMLMAVGGALIGAVVGWYGLGAGLASIGPVGWAIIIIGVILMILGSLFGAGDCDDIEIEFECKAWEAPVGGADCEKCNDDPLKPCSEYRCESLGAACELMNVGTDNELCGAMEDDGKAPVLSPQYDVISDGIIYDDVSSSGFSLNPSGGGCIDAYTPLMFGVVTSELAHCKFDFEATDFESLGQDLGGNAYLINHTTVFSLPDPSHGQSQGYNWTGDLSLFVRCQDVYGILNDGFYEIEMCVNEGEDISAPRVVKTTPKNDELVGVVVGEVELEIVTNELATCWWSERDIIHSEMENEMYCGDSFGAPSDVLGYVCNSTLLLGEQRQNYTYYIRCGDQPWLNDSERNFNLRSFVYEVRRPESVIVIDSVEPGTDFQTSTDMTTVELRIATSGGGEEHFCSYSFSGYENMIELFETGGNRMHTQIFNRPAGRNEIFVECEDETGDFARGVTEFEIIHDSSIPQVSRIWQDQSFVNLILNEGAECKYSLDGCKFVWDEGVSIGEGKEFEFGVVKGKKYFIRCKDVHGNVPSGCLVELVAT
ncbi:hypothetical protein K8R30_00500 [archaeon]|nr:hypothetical protein [archaeon]